jgi:chemotaxis protein methyltransferase CheR
MNEATEADWKLLTDLLEERFRLNFSGARQEILGARLRPRLEALHLDGLREYYHYLCFHPGREEELAELTRRITNNETYFFREAAQFDAIVRHVLPESAHIMRERPLRILSAACSSGEEPYSLSVRLVDSGSEFMGARWEIDACDLNPDRLECARRAVYEGFAFRNCDEETRRRCFQEVEPGRFLLRERYRRAVRFFHANLAAPFVGTGWGSYDVILCRNVLIYFAADGFDRLISRFAQLLRPGGYLFLGHSESLFDRGADFEPAYFPDSMAYRRIRCPA